MPLLDIQVSFPSVFAIFFVESLVWHDGFL